MELDDNVNVPSHQNDVSAEHFIHLLSPKTYGEKRSKRTSQVVQRQQQADKRAAISLHLTATDVPEEYYLMFQNKLCGLQELIRVKGNVNVV